MAINKTSSVARQPDIQLPVVENLVGIDTNEDPILVYTPQSHCCNCGTRSGLTSIATTFIQKSTYSTNYDDRLQFDLTLPYCGDCGRNAGKYPPSSVIKIVIGFILWMGMAMALSIYLPAPYAWLRAVEVFAPILFVYMLFRWWDRPRAPQTSKYTPVSIKEFSGQTNAVHYVGAAAFIISGLAALLRWLVQTLSKRNPRAIERLTFRFSNPLYAKAFYKTNGGNLKKGVVRIS